LLLLGRIYEGFAVQNEKKMRWKEEVFYSFSNEGFLFLSFFPSTEGSLPLNGETKPLVVNLRG
jgi:hypothetical protein